MGVGVHVGVHVCVCVGVGGKINNTLDSDREREM